MPRKNDLSKRGRDRNQWMVAYVTNNYTEAQIVAGRLKHEGIMAILDHLAGRNAIGFTIGAWGEVKVLVHPEDYDLAMDILFPDEPDMLEDGEEDEDTIYLDDWEADDDDK